MPRRTCCATPACAGRRRVPGRARGRAGRPGCARGGRGAIRRLDADPEVEVIIVARGGGDFQNLLGFSDERLVRAAAAASHPGRLARSATRPTGRCSTRSPTCAPPRPTDAAKRVVPDVAEELVRVGQARARLGMRLHRHARPRDRPHRAPALAPRARRRPDGSSTDRAEELTRWVAARRRNSSSVRSSEPTPRVAELRGHLRALSPQAHARARLRDRAAPDGHVLRARAARGTRFDGSPTHAAADPPARRVEAGSDAVDRRAATARSAAPNRMAAMPPTSDSPSSATSRRATSSCGRGRARAGLAPPSSSRSHSGSAARRSPHAARSGSSGRRPASTRPGGSGIRIRHPKAARLMAQREPRGRRRARPPRDARRDGRPQGRELAQPPPAPDRAEPRARARREPAGRARHRAPRAAYRHRRSNRDIDVAAVAQQAQIAIDDPLAVPELPEGWRANARRARARHRPTASPRGTSATSPRATSTSASYQGIEANPTWVAGQLARTLATGTDHDRRHRVARSTTTASRATTSATPRYAPHDRGRRHHVRAARHGSDEEFATLASALTPTIDAQTLRGHT